MSVLKRLMCRHAYNIDRWHFTHGQFGNEPAYIEGFKKCAFMDGCTYHDVLISGLTKTGRHVDITDMLKGKLE